MSPTSSRLPPIKDKQRLVESLEPSWRSELSQKLFDLLYPGELDGVEFQGGLQALIDEYEDEAYSELLYLLSHLRFEPAEARDHWRGIAEHRERMAAAMESAV
ncbi:MAG: hypothetical protein WBP36_11900, partial [Thermoanaerobaculia bacterium]